jgi:hypothetical protein
MRRKAITVLLACVVCLVTVVASEPLLLVHTRCMCTIESIDVAAGRKRVATYRFFVRVSDNVEDTVLTRLYQDLIGTPPPPMWRTVNAYYPGAQHSPSFIYHSAFLAIKFLDDAMSCATFSVEAKEVAARTILGLLSDEKNCAAAADYALALLRTSQRKHQEAASLESRDLPMILPGGEIVLNERLNKR